MQLHCAVILSRVQTVSAIGFKGEVTEFRLVKFWLCYEICGENLSKDLTNMGPRGRSPFYSDLTLSFRN